MKKLSFLALIVTLAAAVPALAGTITYSGTALAPSASVSYAGNPGDAQYVPASGIVPALAQLITADAGTGPAGDSPAVFVVGPTGDLSAFSASYDLYSSNVPSGTSVYFILYLTDDSGFTLPIVADGGSTLNASSLVHTGDLISGSITLTALDALIDPNSGLPYGDSTVAYAGVEIGDWAVSDSIGASANIESITVSTPEGGSGNLYLLLAGAACFAALFLGRRPGSASAPAN
ncbi:MAG: hypothetical protein ABSG11_22645 [Candidatus Korobacteraceae bacterium]|jgi:hypothetical protein